MHFRALGAFAIAAAMLSACRAPQAHQQVAGYYGPTEPMPRVVEAINQNANLAKTLRGAGSFEAWVKDENGKSHYVNGQVTLLYAQPQSFRLIGKKDIAGAVFEIGSNDDRYWMILRGPADTMWTGEYKNIDHVDPQQIPVQPNLLLEVLGAAPIPTNFLAPPVPVMRFNNDADAYMFVWNFPLKDRWAAQKEVWYDRQTRLPKLVLLFDPDGRIVLRAYLSNHRAAGENGPIVATSYRVFFPDTGSRMSIDLNEDIALKRNNAPGPQSFIYPGERAGVSRIVDLDELSAP